jgi:hypothetical protein
VIALFFSFIILSREIFFKRHVGHRMGASIGDEPLQTR